MNDKTPVPFDPTLYLIEKRNQVPATFQAAPMLPPKVSLARRAWEHFGRFAPLAVTTSMSALAWGWGEHDGTLAPLWITGTLAVFTGCAGCVSAAKVHGDNETMRMSFGGAAALVVAGLTAWTPSWELAALLWVGCTAAVYAVCAPLWRSDRREERAQLHEQTMEHIKGENVARTTAITAAGEVAREQWKYRQEEAKVQAIVEASTARRERMLEPGQELNVQALLKAAQLPELN
ncbi:MULTISPECIES: hypothetical protein [unclassified Streptomyces]|uniref:hypothetical protein n=1 Tax=unclassified Streptomyces TaxID=2593676 RepID=UPI00278BC8C1|nr:MULTISPECIES: hypothetical protein [unclassified Streptomyces]